METTKVGIREFRADMADYIASSTPVAITRHGHTIGFFIPTPANADADADFSALRKAGQALDKLLAKEAVDVEGLVAEFKAARKSKTVVAARKKPKAKPA
jgi:UDP-N-acetyl-D-mannosaminuronate dehydrogenase